MDSPTCSVKKLIKHSLKYVIEIKNNNLNIFGHLPQKLLSLVFGNDSFFEIFLKVALLK
jgi:hypothetical protein